MTSSDHFPPLLIASAPNGARKTRQDHRRIPITAAQLADTAADVMQAGARMIHLHARDERGKHTLDAGACKAAIEAVRARTGDDLFIQITSESGGIYDAAQQRQALYAFSADNPDSIDSPDSPGPDNPDGISIALRELIRDEADVPPARELFHHLAHRHLLLQYILFSGEDIARYHSLLEQGVIPPGNHSVLLVVGRYGEQQSTPETLHQMVDALHTPMKQPMNPPLNWMVCAFGEHEFDCLTEAAKLGGHVRVGFENTLRLKSGQTATDNRQLITQLIESGNPVGRPLADIHQARKILGSETAA